MLNILLLCNKPKPGDDANTIVDHIEAIENYSRHTIWLYSNLGAFSPSLNLDLFDVIIIHYSSSLLYSHFISDEDKKKISAFKGLKVVLVQDEYRQINKMILQLQSLKIDVLFTCFPEGEMDKIYTKAALPHLSLYNNLTGYIPKRLLEQTDLPLTKERICHVGYRGRHLPFWLGELAYEKSNIIDKWTSTVKRDDVRIDISYNEKDRIYGKKWTDFLLSCKATLGVESGASVMDFTGELEKNIDLHQSMHLKDDFYKVQALFLKDHEGKYKLNQISPRCFEAIALKTVLVLYEGEYSKILIPGRHYILLKKDFSNINEVINKLLNDDYLQEMAETAYKEVALNPEYSYRNYIVHLDDIISIEFKQRNIRKIKKSYSREEFEKVKRYIHFKKKIDIFARDIFKKLPASWRFVVKFFINRLSLTYSKFMKKIINRA